MGFYQENGGQKKHGQEWYYLLPGRPQRTASLAVNIDKNLWFDHSTGEKGNIIDLVCKINSTNTSGALEILSNLNANHPHFSFSPQKIVIENPSTIEIVSVDEVSTTPLIDYIKSRCISVSLAKKYLKEVHYRNNKCNKTFFALGFKNDRGGYELRNALFPSCISPKDITTVNGRCNSVLNLVEGFFDFLSILTSTRKDQPDSDTIILNTVAFTGKVLEIVNRYDQINLFLDNDDAGQRASATVKNQHPNVINYSCYYNNSMISMTS